MLSFHRFFAPTQILKKHINVELFLRILRHFVVNLVQISIKCDKKKQPIKPTYSLEKDSTKSKTSIVILNIVYGQIKVQNKKKCMLLC